MIEQPGRDYCAEALESAEMKPNGRGRSSGGHQNGGPEAGGQTAKFKTPDPWPVMDGAAYYGLAGEIVRTIAPHSEADPAALLAQVLVFFGNLIGNSAHYRVEADHHHANVFVVLVGRSAKGRKGTSGGRIRSVIQPVDQQWIEERMKGGLSSGEGLINEVRDEVQKWNPKKKKLEIVDPGVSDKRLMVTEAEFGNALAVMERPGNTLSPIIRKAWDGHTLSSLTKNCPLKATKPHISVVGHITEDELRAGITRTEMANGFANRFLFVCVRRSKLLPHGGSLHEAETQTLGDRIKAAVDMGKSVGRLQMTEAARRQWETIYPHLSAECPGLLGAITARAEAQCVRLALIYALLDQQEKIDEPHLRAALALWEYCETSAARIFGAALGDPIADEIMRALIQAGGAGMSRTAIRDLFGRNRSSDRIGVALALLIGKGRAKREVKDTGGRPVEIWFAMKEGRHG
jgi:hypothetical protein